MTFLGNGLSIIAFLFFGMLIADQQPVQVPTLALGRRPFALAAVEFARIPETDRDPGHDRGAEDEGHAGAGTRERLADPYRSRSPGHA